MCNPILDHAVMISAPETIFGVLIYPSIIGADAQLSYTICFHDGTQTEIRALGTSNLDLVRGWRTDTMAEVARRRIAARSR
jgi:hypothetical protein